MNLSTCNAPLTPEQRILYEAQLKEAQAAYHNLMLGTSARVIVDQNGERVEFSAANKVNLYNYILQLQGILGICVPTMMLPGRPATFIM